MEGIFRRYSHAERQMRWSRTPSRSRWCVAFWVWILWQIMIYCWWRKSCTTKDDDYPLIYRVLTIPGGAGFLPSKSIIIYILSKQIICNSMWDLRLGAIEWRDLLQEELDNGQTTCWMWLKWCKGRLRVWWVYVSILLVGTVWGAINSRHFKSVPFSWGRWILMWLGTLMQSTSSAELPAPPKACAEHPANQRAWCNINLVLQFAHFFVNHGGYFFSDNAWGFWWVGQIVITLS